MPRLYKDRYIPDDDGYILDVDSRWVDAIPLEDLVDEKNWIAKYLVHKDWSRSYILNPRSYWGTRDYFDYARKRIRELGIIDP